MFWILQWFHFKRCIVFFSLKIKCTWEMELFGNGFLLHMIKVWETWIIFRLRIKKKAETTATREFPGNFMLWNSRNVPRKGTGRDVGLVYMCVFLCIYVCPMKRLLPSVTMFEKCISQQLNDFVLQHESWGHYILYVCQVPSSMYLNLSYFRSSHQRCSMKKGVLRNFTKFTGKHLC